MESITHQVLELLQQARQSHTQYDALDAGLQLTQPAHAYAIQKVMGQAQAWWEGEVPRTWKTGATSPHALQTNAPLPDAGVWSSPADASQWPMHFRGIEAEIAFRVGDRVTADQALCMSHGDVLSCFSDMAVSIELVDSRWVQGMEAPDLLKLADLQSHGALVLGSWQPCVQRNWAEQVCRQQIGERQLSVTGMHPVQDPTLLLCGWLRHVCDTFGAVPSGTVVTTGTWTGLLYAQPGDAVEVQFPGMGTASVRL